MDTLGKTISTVVKVIGGLIALVIVGFIVVSLALILC